METAVFGFVGVVIGGLVTVFGAYLNNRKELRLKHFDRDNLRQDLKLRQYAEFLGAYQQAQGTVADIVVLMKEQPEHWAATIHEAVGASPFSGAVERLNRGVPWLSLLCRNPKASELASQLSTQHDSLMNALCCAKDVCLQGRRPDWATIDRCRNALESTHLALLDVLRADVS